MRLLDRVRRVVLYEHYEVLSQVHGALGVHDAQVQEKKVE